MRRSEGSCPALLVAALGIAACSIAACSSEDAGPGTDTTQPSEEGPTGACSCPAASNAASPTVVSLECFCADTWCPTFEELTGDLECLPFGTEWTWTRHEGCGRITLDFNGGLGGSTYVYDASTLELIGAAQFSDVAFGPCGASSYRGGVAASCREGSVCALCEGSDACVPACSTEAFERRFGDVGEITLEDFAGVYDCAGQEAQERIVMGCGRIRIEASEGVGGYVYEFDAATHALLAFTSGTDDDGQRCGGVWGEPGSPCAEEATCSLCEGDANVCQF